MMTKEELLTQESLKELLIYDTSTGEFVWTKQIPGRRKRKVGTIRPDGYVMIHIVGKFYLAHRLAWLYINGEWPEGEIDHIDRNPSNNAFANLRGANLYGANLCDANLCDANLRGADLLLLISQRSILPEGDLIGWKKLNGEKICKLRIPADAKRVGGLVGRKCRAEYAEVLDGGGVSGGFSGASVTYKNGCTVKPNSYDPNPLVECSNGIHFFITKKEAEDYSL